MFLSNDIVRMFHLQSISRKREQEREREMPLLPVFVPCVGGSLSAGWGQRRALASCLSKLFHVCTVTVAACGVESKACVNEHACMLYVVTEVDYG